MGRLTGQPGGQVDSACRAFWKSVGHKGGRDDQGAPKDVRRPFDPKDKKNAAAVEAKKALHSLACDRR